MSAIPILPSQTSTYAVWHTPEILTTILSKVKAPPANSTTYKWKPDICGVMRTSKYGLDIGAELLYESEGDFPRGEEEKRFDMMGYLEEKGCPPARIELYCSRVRIFKVSDTLSAAARNRLPIAASILRSPDTTIGSLWLYLRRLISIYPSLKDITVLLGQYSVRLKRHAATNQFTSLRVTVYRSGALDQPSCPGCTSDIVKQVLKQVTNPGGKTLPVRGLTLKFHILRGFPKDFSSCLLRLSPTKKLGAHLQYLGAQELSVSWNCFKAVLDGCPRLLDIRVKVTFSATDSDNFSGATYPRIQVAVLVLRHGTVDRLHECMNLFPKVRILSVDFDEPADRPRRSFQDDSHYNHEVARCITTGQNIKPLGRLTNLDLSGSGMTPNTALDLLQFSPMLVDLKFYGGELVSGSESAFLKDLAAYCPNLSVLKLIPHRSHFPFLPIIDAFAMSLPHLRVVILPVTFPSQTEITARLYPTTSSKPDRWQTLQVGTFLFSEDYQLSGKERPVLHQPFYGSAAELLHHCFPRETVLHALPFGSEELHPIWSTVRLNGMQWWTDVESSLEQIRRKEDAAGAGAADGPKAEVNQGGVGDEASVKVPGWAMVKTSVVEMEE